MRVIITTNPIGERNIIINCFRDPNNRNVFFHCFQLLCNLKEKEKGDKRKKRRKGKREKERRGEITFKAPLRVPSPPRAYKTLIFFSTKNFAIVFSSWGPLRVEIKGRVSREGKKGEKERAILHVIQKIKQKQTEKFPRLYPHFCEYFSQYQGSTA